MLMLPLSASELITLKGSLILLRESGGDFNEVLDEHFFNRRLRSWGHINKFWKFVDDCDLIDINFEGYPYTWCNNFISPYSTRARLDRALGGKGWDNYFPEAKLIHLSSNYFDHLPLLLVCGGQFQDIKHKGREEDPGQQVFSGIRNSRFALLQWKREALGNVQQSNQGKQGELDALNEGVITTSTKSGDLQLRQPLSGISRFTDAPNVLMEMPFTVEDVRRSLFSMKGGKARARWYENQVFSILLG
ncbi:hypothetical protein LIER_30893 [Lithospermum erythrorhizon]|uniref:Uncharacterized protein n=1 Tax=Lithospermum erythrorhizon TaxID=34254 RepID=A0AAV3RSW4_LITER